MEDRVLTEIEKLLIEVIGSEKATSFTAKCLYFFLVQAVMFSVNQILCFKLKQPTVLKWSL